MTLNLQRDLGFFLHNIDQKDSDDRQEILSDLQDVVMTPEISHEFETYEEFSKTLDSISDSSHTQILKRAQIFFDDVSEIYETGGDVYYELQFENCNLLGTNCDLVTQTLYVDYEEKKSPEDLYKYLLNNVHDFEFEFLGYYFRGSNLQEGELDKQSADIQSTDPCDMEAVQCEDQPHTNKEEHLIKKEPITPKQKVYESKPINLEDIQKVIAPLKASDQARVMEKLNNVKYVDIRKNEFEQYTTGNKYPVHREFAEELTKTYPNLTADMIMSVLLVESKGEKTAVSLTGRHFGLMQVSEEVFTTHVKKYKKKSGASDTDIPEYMYKYDDNMAAGTDYLDWCLKFNNNPTQNIAIALANYNWGCGFVNQYFDGEKESLPDDTIKYIANYIIYMNEFDSQN